jgi:hypothetical protein
MAINVFCPPGGFLDTEIQTKEGLVYSGHFVLPKFWPFFGQIS